MRSTLRRALQIIAVVVVLLAFVPSGAGGAADYVTVTGSSMSPTLETGDTVMLTRHDHYAVGDIIAYRSQGLGGVVVIHRIIQLAGDGRYLTKGDNNGFVDQYRPADNDILGARVASLPDTTSLRRFLSGPAGIAVAIGVGFFVIALGGSTGVRHHHRSRKGAGS